MRVQDLSWQQYGRPVLLNALREPSGWLCLHEPGMWRDCNVCQAGCKVAQHTKRLSLEARPLALRPLLPVTT